MGKADGVDLIPLTLTAACYGDTDKDWHGYLKFYERHLVPAEISTLTEIGVWTGGSLRMWARWMPHARVIGIDIEAANYVIASEEHLDNITFIEGDVTTIEPWASDVVIDDGSHHGDDQLAAFDRFWPLLTSGGWYVIEDLESVWDETYFRRGDLMTSWLSHRLEDALRDLSIGRQVVELH